MLQHRHLNQYRHMYQKVADEMRRRICSGEFPVETRLPGRRELAEEFGCTSVTIRSAMQVLLDEGYIVMRQGLRPMVVRTSPAPRRWTPQGSLVPLIAQLRELCDEWTAAATSDGISPELFSELPFLAIEIQIMADRIHRQAVPEPDPDTDTDTD